MTGSVGERRVSFNEIEILEFHYILGDNPAVSQGAPVALGNDLVRQKTKVLDEYELSRCGKRKNRKKLTLPVQERAQILLGRGYSLESIANATLTADTINKERINSVNKQKWDGVNEVTERFGRYIKKAFVPKKNMPKQLTVNAISA